MANMQPSQCAVSTRIRAWGIYIFFCIHTYIYIHIHMYIYIYLYLYVYLYLYICVAPENRRNGGHMSGGVYIYIYTYILFIFIFIFIHVSQQCAQAPPLFSLQTTVSEVILNLISALIEHSSLCIQSRFATSPKRFGNLSNDNSNL